MIETSSGKVPISNFVTKSPKRNVSFIRRYDSRNAMYVKANVEEGITPTSKVTEIETSVTTLIREDIDSGNKFKHVSTLPWNT